MLLDSKAIWRLFGGVKSWRKVGVTVYDQGTVQKVLSESLKQLILQH